MCFYKQAKFTSRQSVCALVQRGRVSRQKCNPSWRAWYWVCAGTRLTTKLTTTITKGLTTKGSITKGRSTKGKACAVRHTHAQEYRYTLVLCANQLAQWRRFGLRFIDTRGCSRRTQTITYSFFTHPNPLTQTL